MDTTLDGLLNRQLMVEQPKTGFRIAMDTIFLSAAIPAQPQQTVLEFGCGVGGAMLCLAFRLPEVQITGIDIQKDIVTLCQKNIIHNGFKARLKAQECAILDVPSIWAGKFNHVMMNPPFHDEKRHSVSSNFSKRTSNTEKKGDLEIWIRKAAGCLDDDGILTLIHRADRADTIGNILSEKFKFIEVLELLPKAGSMAKRILMRAHKLENSLQNIVYAKPLILHNDDDSYTKEAENILRYGQGLSFVQT